MKGAKYSVYDNALCQGDPVYGPVAVNSSVVKLNYQFDIGTTYYVKEVEAPTSGLWAVNDAPVKVKFDIPEDTKEDDDCTVDYNAVCREYEDDVKVKVRVRKTSTITDAGYDWLSKYVTYSLANAGYTFYWDKEGTDPIGTIWTHTMTENGKTVFYTKKLSIPGLKLGETRTIYYEEVQAPAGHNKNEGIKSLNVTAPLLKTLTPEGWLLIIKITEGSDSKKATKRMEGSSVWQKHRKFVWKK